jgi:hypothetical protein
VTSVARSCGGAGRSFVVRVRGAPPSLGSPRRDAEACCGEVEVVRQTGEPPAARNCTAAETSHRRQRRGGARGGVGEGHLGASGSDGQTQRPRVSSWRHGGVVAGSCRVGGIAEWRDHGGAEGSARRSGAARRARVRLRLRGEMGCRGVAGC